MCRRRNLNWEGARKSAIYKQNNLVSKSLEASILAKLGLNLFPVSEKLNEVANDLKLNDESGVEVSDETEEK